MESLVFDKWDSNVNVSDPGLRNYIYLDAKLVPLTQGKHSEKQFGKRRVHIIERLINTLMRSGTGDKIGGKVIRGRGGCGKKTKMYNVIEDAFDEIYRQTGQNPIELLVRAVENSAPREETTRVKYGGVIYHVAVDISPQRRLDFSLRNIGKAVVMRSFDKKKSAAMALAEEIILASKDDSGSHAISRKVEIERVARSSR